MAGLKDVSFFIYYTAKQLTKILQLSCGISFKAPTLKATQAHAKYFANKTYFYTFDYRGQYSHADGAFNKSSPFYDGVHHADDLFYLFPEPGQQLNDVDKKVSELFVDLWTSFAINGVPKSSNAVDWLPFTSMNCNVFFLFWKFKTALFSHTEYTGPFLHIDKEAEIGDDFLPELMVVSREANSGSIMTSLTTVNAVVSLVLFYLLS